MKKLTTFISHGSIRNGRLVLKNNRYFRGLIAQFEDTEKVRVTIEKERGTRTAKQNAYYWGVVLPEIGEYVGERVEELHEIFKSRYLRKKRVWRGGEITTIKSTSELTSDEFGEYLQRVIEEAAALGVIVPEADKNWNLKETTRTD